MNLNSFAKVKFRILSIGDVTKSKIKYLSPTPASVLKIQKDEIIAITPP